MFIIEAIIERIGRNNIACLEQLQLDLENLDSSLQPKTPRKRTTKHDKNSRSKKRKLSVASFSDDEAIEGLVNFVYF